MARKGRFGNTIMDKESWDKLVAEKGRHLQEGSSVRYVSSYHGPIVRKEGTRNGEKSNDSIQK